ncbi:helix-turn-helix domain-containing protein [Bradyrhizobium sp. S3.2.12]|uniref:helix-turn-helix domain-containing protein n=1 Tax=Bradyrhizobium sp. S3.2.12 TaxID=3156387 RepID=UPI00339A1A17
MASTDSKTRTNRRRETRNLFVWLDQIRGDPDLSPVAFKVAYEIGQHFNARHGGAAWPSSLTIAANVGVGKATVIRAVRQLRERGYLNIDPGKAGRGHSNQYFMGMPKGASPHLKPAARTRAGAGSRNAKKRSISEPFREPIKGPFETQKGPPVDLNYLEPPMGPPSAVPKGERERSRSLACIPGAPAPVGGAREEGKEAVDRLVVDRFAELLAIWRRPWGEDDAAAHRALAVACREADPDDIIAAARAWVSAVEPRFLKPLATWLTNGLWQNQPPQRKPTRNGGKVSLSALALEIGNQYGGR